MSKETIIKQFVVEEFRYRALEGKVCCGIMEKELGKSIKLDDHTGILSIGIEKIQMRCPWCGGRIRTQFYDGTMAEDGGD